MLDRLKALVAARRAGGAPPPEAPPPPAPAPELSFWEMFMGYWHELHPPEPQPPAPGEPGSAMLEEARRDAAERRQAERDLAREMAGSSGLFWPSDSPRGGWSSRARMRRDGEDR